MSKLVKINAHYKFLKPKAVSSLHYLHDRQKALNFSPKYCQVGAFAFSL